MATDRLPVKMLTPSARPVDTYVRPAERGVQKPGYEGDNLMQLAQGLQKVHTPLQKFFREKLDERDVEEEAQAKRDFNRLQMSFSDAAKLWEKSEGKAGIPPGASPFYIMNYKRMAGEWNAEKQYKGFLTQQWEQSGLATKLYDNEAEAQADFFSFLKDTRNTFAEKYGNDGEGNVDSDWFDGFLSKSESVEGMLTNQHLSTRYAENEKRALSLIEDKVTDTLAGIPLEDQPTEIQQLFETNGDQWGVSGRKFNQQVIGAFDGTIRDLVARNQLFAAKEQLKVIDDVQTGSGVLGRTKAGVALKAKLLSLIENTENAKEAEERSRESHTWAKEDRALRRRLLENSVDNIGFLKKERQRAKEERNKKDSRDLTFSMALYDILSEPGKDHEQTFEALAKDPNTASLVPSLRAAWDARLNADSRVNMTPEMQSNAARLRIDIISGEANMSDIQEAIDNRQIDMTLMGQMLQDYVQHRRYQEQIDSSSARVREHVNEGESWISRTLSKRDTMGQEVNAKLITQAMMEYQDLMYEFLAQNPGASPAKVRRERNNIIKELVNDPMYQHDFVAGKAPPLMTPGEARGVRTTKSLPQWAR